MTKWYFTFGHQWNQVLMRMLELYMNDGIEQERFMEIIEQELQRATRSIAQRKGLDVSRFQDVWDARSQMRREMAALPERAR